MVGDPEPRPPRGCSSPLEVLVNNRLRFRVLLALLLALITAPAWAGGFSLFGSYLDLDEPDAAAGLGIRFDLAMGSHWTFDVAFSYHEEAEVVLDTDLVQIDIVEEVRFIPLDLGVRYHFGDSDGVSPYLGGGFSHMEIDTKLGEGDALQGFYAIVGVTFGDDVGPKFFVEALARGYEDVEVDLFEELDSSNRDEFAVDGFSAAAGVRWRFGR